MQLSKMMAGQVNPLVVERQGRRSQSSSRVACKCASASQNRVFSRRVEGMKSMYLNALARETDWSLSKAMERTAELWFEAETQKDPQIEEIVDSDCIFTDKMNGWVFRGRNAIRNRMIDFNSAYPDFELSVLDIMTNADRRSAACHWAGTGTNLGCIADSSPTGVRCRLSGVHLFTFDTNGIIIDALAYRELLEEECKLIY